ERARPLLPRRRARTAPARVASLPARHDDDAHLRARPGRLRDQVGRRRRRSRRDPRDGHAVAVGSPGALAIKQQLAEAIRMLARAEIVDHSGHGSGRRDRGSFFINSGASTRGTLTADDMGAIALEGAPVEGAPGPPLEFPLHSAIYRARPDVQAVLHTHPRWSTLLTMVGVGYQVVYAQG